MLGVANEFESIDLFGDQKINVSHVAMGTREVVSSMRFARAPILYTSFLV